MPNVRTLQLPGPAPLFRSVKGFTFVACNCTLANPRATVRTTQKRIFSIILFTNCSLHDLHLSSVPQTNDDSICNSDARMVQKSSKGTIFKAFLINHLRAPKSAIGATLP